MKRRIVWIVAVAILCTSLTGCQSGALLSKRIEDSNRGKTVGEEVKRASLKEEDVEYLKSFEDLVEVPFEPVSFTPEVKDYTVAEDLSNVVNLQDFGEFTPAQRKALAEKGFFIAPWNGEGGEEKSMEEQLFRVYEDNEYKNLPSFVTTDSVLHIYHLFYDNFLRELEEKELFPKLVSLVKAMEESSMEQYNDVKDETVKGAALRNTAFFGTALLLLGEPLPENMPPKAGEMAKVEAAMADSEAPGNRSEILEVNLDFSQLRPRGHYTKSDTLKKYFQTVMYFGQGAFLVHDEVDYRDDLMVMALLITEGIFRNKENYKLWSDLYEPVNFLVEGADDLTPKDFAKLLYGIYGREPDLNDLANPESLARLYREVEKFPKPQVADFLGYSFRFMPQRGVMDAVWMQRLLDIATDVEPSNRPIYSGLDVMAVMGSDLATDIQLSDPWNKKWAEYPTRLMETKEKVQGMPEALWQKNLYRGWLWTLKEMTEKLGEGYPKFMQSKSWEKKNLNGALGSWAELKHDTVLYGKQTMAEMGGGGYPEIPKSYVEPNPRVYEKLSWLIHYTQQNLKARNMLSSRLDQNLTGFKKMTDLLLEISLKELRNETLTKEELQELDYIGETMEGIALRFINDDSGYWELLDEGDREMAIASDLMKVPKNNWGLPEGTFLEGAIGPAYQIFVVYPVGEELYLGRGGVFSYREFLSENRLTDEEWRSRLEKNKEEGTPKWMEGEVLEAKGAIPYPDVEY